MKSGGSGGFKPIFFIICKFSTALAKIPNLGFGKPDEVGCFKI
jgi:hypothetical protein